MHQKTNGNTAQKNCLILDRSRPFRHSISSVTFLFLQWLLLPAANAQSVKDTIFYDNYWRICEKPVARYFRLGELQVGSQWHFINDVKDFYTEGQLEMTGHYSSAGKKDGVFTFYHPNGKIKKTGTFVNDTMKGTWSYYDAKGGLYFQVNCGSSRSYTPLFIRNSNGDTLLKAGTGRFAYKLLDYPDVFPLAKDYLVKGQCFQGKRAGEWVYDYFFDNSWHLYAKEVYEGNVFQSGQGFFFFAAGKGDLQQPVFLGELTASKLIQTATFVHDPVFGEYVPGAHAPLLTAFLLHGETPIFTAQTKKFEANAMNYLPLCAAAIGYGQWSTSKLFWHGGDIGAYKPNQESWLVAYCLQTDNGEVGEQSDLFPVEKLKNYNAQISFDIYEDGTISDVAVKGNFEKDIMVHIAYYLSRLTGLAPLREGGKAIPTKQNLYLFTKVNEATYRKHSYIVYRLLLSLRPEVQTNDKFDVAGFAKAVLGNNDE